MTKTHRKNTVKYFVNTKPDTTSLTSRILAVSFQVSRLAI